MKWSLSSLEWNMKRCGLDVKKTEDREIFEGVMLHRGVTELDQPPELVELPRLKDSDFELMREAHLDPEDPVDLDVYRWNLARKNGLTYTPIAVPEGVELSRGQLRDRLNKTDIDDMETRGLSAQNDDDVRFYMRLKGWPIK